MSKRKNALKTELLLPNNGSKSVSPENIKEGQTLAITINPELQFYQVIDPSDRFNLWTSNVYKLLKELRYIVNMKLYPEISQTGRLHLHGYLNISCPAEFFLSDLPYIICKIGHIEIDTISEDLEGRNKYSKYVKKCGKLMEELTSTNLHYNHDDEEINFMYIYNDK